MAYNNNVPLVNQTIASTTVPIHDNFAFLDTGIGQEHNFDVTDATKMYHLQASMPNKGADPGALPAGTNGMYYVKGAQPKFFDGANVWQLMISGVFQKTASGIVALNTGSDTVFFTSPAYSCGVYFIIPQLTITAQNASAMGFFVSSNTDVQLGNASSFDPNISITTSGLAIRARVATAPLNGNYTVVVLYFTP